MWRLSVEKKRLHRLMSNTRPALRCLYDTLSSEEKHELARALGKPQKGVSDEDVFVHTIVLVRERGVRVPFYVIAERLNMNVKTVRYYYETGMRKLRNILEDKGYDETDFIGGF